jgi:cytochrome P450
VVVFAPFLHRDDERLPYADAFEPGLWLGEREDVARAAALIPFSAGPVECPGRNLVLLTTSTLVSRLLDHAQPVFDGRIPATLSPFRLRFAG